MECPLPAASSNCGLPPGRTPSSNWSRSRRLLVPVGLCPCRPRRWPAARRRPVPETAGEPPRPRRVARGCFARRQQGEDPVRVLIKRGEREDGTAPVSHLTEGEVPVAGGTASRRDRPSGRPTRTHKRVRTGVHLGMCSAVHIAACTLLTCRLPSPDNSRSLCCSNSAATMAVFDGASRPCCLLQALIAL